MLYQVRDFFTDQMLLILYHSFACNRVSYGNIAWETAADKYLKEVETKFNNTVRTITWNKKFSRMIQLYKNLNFLKLRNVSN